MIDEIKKEIDEISNNLSILPTKTKKNKIEYDDYIETIEDHYKELLSEVETTIRSRRDMLQANIDSSYVVDNMENEEFAKIDLDKPLDTELIAGTMYKSDSLDKMNLSRYLYEFSHFYENNLDGINDVILEIIKIFESVGVKLTAKDFNYTEGVQAYITTLLNDPYKIHQEFEKLYWENSTLITQIELNFRYLYFKYKKQIDKFYKSKYSGVDSQKYLTNYAKKKIYVEKSKHDDRKYIANRVISGKFVLDGSMINKVNTIMGNAFVDMENPSNYENLSNLCQTLKEYYNYMKYEFLIDEFKELYASKSEFKNLYPSKRKEINKKERELFKYNRRINSKFPLYKKDKSAYKLARNNCINELHTLYEELDELKVKKAIYNYVDDKYTYEDLLKMSALSFSCYRTLYQMHKRKEDKDAPDENLEVLTEDIKKLFNFVFGNELNIVNNVTISEDKDINKMIADKYILLNVNVSTDRLTLEEIEFYIKDISDAISFLDIERNDLKLDELKFIIYVNNMDKN